MTLITPMRALLTLAVCLVAPLPVFAQHPTAYTSAVTPGGIRYLYRYDAETPYAAITFGRVVERALPDTKEASYGLIPALIFQSADKAGSNEFAERLQDIHAGASISAGQEEFSVQVKAPAAEFSRALKLVVGALTTAEPADKPYRRLRLNAEGAQAQSEVRAETIATRTAYTLTLGNHVIVRQFDAKRYADTAPADVDLWRKVVLGRDGLVVAVSGRISDAEAAGAIDASLGGWPALAAAARGKNEPIDLKPQTIVVEQPGRQASILMLGRTGYARGHETEIAGLAMGPLGGGVESRLGDAVRVALGASYGVGAGIRVIDRDQRLIALATAVDTGKVADSIAAMRKAYERWQQQGLNDREMTSQRTRMIGGRDGVFNDPSAANRLVFNALINDRTLEDVNGFADRLKALSRDDLNAFIKAKFPRVEELLIVVVTPDAKALAADCVIKAAAEALSCKKK